LAPISAIETEVPTVINVTEVPSMTNMTEAPTMFNDTETPSLTEAPTNVTEAPSETVAPTNVTEAPIETLEDSITLNKACFSPNEEIVVDFTIQDPTLSDWIGIFSTEGVNENFDNLPEPAVWEWSCDGEGCTATIGSFTMSTDSLKCGLEDGCAGTWPLSAPGRYFLALSDDESPESPPYVARVISQFFDVSNACPESDPPTGSPTSSPTLEAVLAPSIAPEGEPTFPPRAPVGDVPPSVPTGGAPPRAPVGNVPPSVPTGSAPPRAPVGELVTGFPTLNPTDTEFPTFAPTVQGQQREGDRPTATPSSIENEDVGASTGSPTSGPTPSDERARQRSVLMSCQDSGILFDDSELSLEMDLSGLDMLDPFQLSEHSEEDRRILHSLLRLLQEGEFKIGRIYVTNSTDGSQRSASRVSL
jgi:hypothetical protein